ncbi:MAG: DNA primase [Planctomycetota bacterium]|jgi:DNA primase
MAGVVGEEQIRQVKDEYTPVQRAGVNFKALCPIHGERTPSFYIYTEQQTYHCFGCGAHGDAISFVREKENLSFVDALELLARRAGVELVFTGGERAREQRGQRERQLAAHEWATTIYERCLWQSEAGAEARAYLAERGLDEAVCRRFRLGWAPGGGYLVEAARRARADARVLVDLDLAVERQGRLVDRFYGRLLFPICNRFGQPVAFSGRLLPAAERAAKEAGRGVGKYINSTDTPLYQKGRVVFNLHQARTACREAGRLVVMEGPTDVMAADQAGLAECCAVLGTALTADHAQQLGRVVGDRGKLILLFDGDAAGQATSIKAARVCLAAGVASRVAVMPEGADPAELLSGEDGRARLVEVLAAAREDIDHLLHAVAPRPHVLDQRARLAAVDSCLATLRTVTDEDLRGGYLTQMATHFVIDRVRMERRLHEGDGGPERGMERHPADTAAAQESLPRLDMSQDAMLHLLIRYPELRVVAFDDHGIEASQFPEPWSAIVDMLVAQPEADRDALILDQRIAVHPAMVAEIYRYEREERTRGQVDLADGVAVLADVAGDLVARSEELLCADLEHRLRRAQLDNDHETAMALFRELTERRRSGA